MFCFSILKGNYPTQQWSNDVCYAFFQFLSERLVRLHAPLNNRLHLQIKMDAKITVLILGLMLEMVFTVRINHRHITALGYTGLEIDGRACVSQISNNKITFTDLRENLIVNVIIAV